ncbi:MAG: hypothetical protein H6839_11815 [Planctomycetes bacterium]|nr:hypothetical protein [Planctomycetota bacterium]
MYGLPIRKWAEQGEFSLICSAWLLELALPEDAPFVMQEAMVRGLEAPAIVHVAGLVNPTKTDYSADLEAAFRSLPHWPESRREALHQLARYWAKAILAGSDEEVVAILDEIDDSYAYLEYPGKPFSDFCYWNAMLGVEAATSSRGQEVLGGVRQAARDYLDNTGLR